MRFLPWRAAINAPSLVTLARSAPAMPGVRAASFFAQSSMVSFRLNINNYLINTVKTQNNAP